MAHSNYKVLTDVDLSNNQLLNVSRIENTEEASKSLFIKTNENTTLEAANLTGNVATGTTSLTTKNSEVTVTGTAIEKITTSKTTTVATSTTETIDSTGINIETPSQTVVATASSKVESPEVTLVTGTPEGTGTNKQAKITLTKTAGIDNSAVTTSAKVVAVDANVTGGSIIQTAPTSTYKADNDNRLDLTTGSAKIASGTESILLSESASTTIASSSLVANATRVEVKENTTTSIKASNSVSVGVGSGDPSPTTIGATASDVAIKSNKVTITGESATEAIKLVAGSTSVSVLPQQVKLDSDGKLFLESDEGVAIKDLKSATITAPIVSEKASTRSEVKSPSITLVTGPFPDSDSTKQASLTLTKTSNTDNSKVDISAKTVAVDANVTGGSITQTAPTSTYKTSEDNKIVLDNTGITLTNNSEVAKLGNGMTSVAGTELNVTTTTVNINHTGTNTISANDIHLHTKGNNPASSLDISSGETTLKSPKVTLNGTGSEGVMVKSGDNSSSIAVKSTTVKIDSKGTLDVSANGNVSVDNPGFTIDIDTKDVLEKATVSSTVRSPKITLVTGTPEGSGNNKQAKIALTKTPGTDDSAINSSAKTVEVTATGSITQTAPTSIYKADDNNKLELGTGSVKITSGTETITLAKAKDGTAAKTTISSGDLVASATKVTVENNTTTSVTSSGSVTVTTRSSDGESSITTKPVKIGLESKEVSLAASVTENNVEKSSSITLSPAASAEEIALSLNTDKNLKISSVKGATIEDNKSIDLKAPDVTETASNSANIYSGNIKLWSDAKDSATEKITLSNTGHTISITANNAGVDIEGNTPSTVTVKGTEFKVSSGKSTFTENSKFNKNVEIVGDLTTKNMSGEAATLNSLDVTATTTVNGTLSTGTARFTSVNGVDATLKQTLTVEGETTVGEGGATIGTLTVNDGATLTAEAGMTAKKAVTVDGTTKVNVTATVGVLTVSNGETLKAQKGLTSNELVEVAGKTTVNETATVGNLSVPNGQTFTAEKGVLANESVTVNNTTTAGTLDVTGTLAANSGLTSKGLVSVENKSSDPTALTVNNTATTGILTVGGTLKTTTGGVTSAGLVEIVGKSPDGKSLTVNDTATTGILTVGGTLKTTTGGVTSAGLVDILNTSNRDKALTVGDIATTGTLTVAGDLKTTTNGVTSAGLVSIENKKSAATALTVSDTATTNTLTVTGDLGAGKGLKSVGLVSIENKKSAATALTVSNTTTTGTLTVAGDLSAGKGLKSAGLVDITGESADGKSLTVSGTATTGTLTISDSTLEAKGGLTATGKVSVGSLTASTAAVSNLSIPSTSTLEATTKMTSGTVTVTGETRISTITGTGSLDIPATLTATNGGTAGSVNVPNIEIKTVMGEGFLKIPEAKTLEAVNGGKATTKFEPANIEIKNVMGEGFLKIPETATLEAVKGGKATEKFEPANVKIATVTGEGSLTIPGNQTLTAMKGGTINGSMTIGKSNSTSTNLELYGNATIGTSGTSGTTLLSYAEIDARSTLAVAEKATFKKNAEIAEDLNLGGVTIRWDSTLGALTFSKG